MPRLRVLFLRLLLLIATILAPATLIGRASFLSVCHIGRLLLLVVIILLVLFGDHLLLAFHIFDLCLLGVFNSITDVGYLATIKPLLLLFDYIAQASPASTSPLPCGATFVVLVKGRDGLQLHRVIFTSCC